MKITNDNRKFPQIEAAFRHMYDNPEQYSVGNVFEFGVGTAQSTRKIVEYIKDNFDRQVKVFGFDTFRGLPTEDVSVDLFPKYKEGTFSQSDNWLELVHKSVNYECFYMNNNLYGQLSSEDYDVNVQGTAILVHIDCDLYISAKQALTWLFSNKIIRHNTLIAYDEYQSTPDPLSGGESKAHHEVLTEFGATATELFHYIFRDKDCNQDIRQSVFKVWLP